MKFPKATISQDGHYRITVYAEQRLSYQDILCCLAHELNTYLPDDEHEKFIKDLTSKKLIGLLRSKITNLDNVLYCYMPELENNEILNKLIDKCFPGLRTLP